MSGNVPKAMRTTLFVVITATLCACATEDVHRGLYVFGHEVETFHPCADSASYWLVPPRSVTGWLHERYDELTTRPYEPVFIEVLGEVSPEPTDGFAAEYSAYFEADSIVSVRMATSSDCRMSEFAR